MCSPSPPLPLSPLPPPLPSFLLFLPHPPPYPLFLPPLPPSFLMYILKNHLEYPLAFSGWTRSSWVALTRGSRFADWECCPVLWANVSAVAFLSLSLTWCERGVRRCPVEREHKWQPLYSFGHSILGMRAGSPFYLGQTRWPTSTRACI